MNNKLPALSLMAALLLVGSCSGKVEPETKASTAQAATVALVTLRPMAGSFAASGLLVPREEASVGSELSGYSVAVVLVEEGAIVRRGQALARLDSGLLQARIAQAQANIAQAEAQAGQARAEAARVDGLDGTGVLSDEQIGARRAAAASANATVNVAKAQLNDLRAQERRMIIRAPVSGVVLERTVRPGDVASPGQPMFRIARDGLIELDAEVPEADLAGMRAGQSANVTLPSGGTFTGRVRLVSPRVDPQTKLARVRISLPRNDTLRAGGFAQAMIFTQADDVRAVPEQAVQFEASGPLIVTVASDNRITRMPVKTGARADGFVALETGPAVGTRVVLGAGAFLLDGDVIKPVQPVAARAATAAPVTER